MKYIATLLFLFFGFAAWTQMDGSGRISLDSLIKLLSKEVSDVNNSQRHAETKELAYFVLERAKREGKPEQIAEVHKELGNWHYYSVTSNNPDSVYYHDLQVLTYLKQTDNQHETAGAAQRVGMDLVSLGRYREAEEYIFAAVAIFEEIDLPLEVASAYSTLNYLYRESKAYDQALIYGEKSLALFEEHGEEDTDLIEPLLGLIFTYPEVDQAGLGLEKAEQVVAIVGETFDWADNVNMANVRSWRGKAHVNVGNYEEALADFIYGWEIIQTIVPEPSDADGWRGDIGNVLRRQGNYAQAIPHIKANLQHLRERNIENWELVEDNQFWLAECYRETGPIDSAYHFLAEAQKSREKRLTEELAAVQNELRIKYDSDQKEATISSQQATILQQRRSQLLVLGIVALLVALLAVILYNARRNRQKNRRLEALNKELTHTNHQLDQRNAQNEVLVKEIHHRVKNNLEIISSLLELQSRQTQDESAQLAMLESQARVKSMGLLHQNLFQNQEQVSIEMREYFQKLSDNLLQTFNVREQVDVAVDMDPIELDMDTAIPIGLMVNELLTNALKYAFPDRRNGRIEVRLRQEDPEHLQLSIADNGVGKQPNNAPQGSGFGSQLIQLLTQQLQGVMQESIGNGTSVTFRLKRVLQRE